MGIQDTQPLRWLEISRSALKNNINVVRKYLHPQAQLACIVKSNAYGHGLKEVVQSTSLLTDAFGVVDFSEAEILRDMGIQKRIIHIGCTLPEHAEAVIQLQVIPVIYSLATAAALNEAGGKAGINVVVVVKVETGMNRCGVCDRELDELMAYLKQAEFVSAIGLSTHFARSDDSDSTWTIAQIKKFEAVKDRYTNLGHNLTFSHTANTGAAFLYPESHHSMVRFGIGLYGLSPSAYVDSGGAHKLIQVLEYKTKVVQIHSVRKGESVSYGGTWTAGKNAKVAILPVGYADGYSRSLSNRNHVIVKGHRAPISGRICMNFFAVDVSDIPDVTFGDEVTLISRDPESGVTVDDLAKLLGTINYEVTTVIPEKISRIIVN